MPLAGFALVMLLLVAQVTPAPPAVVRAFIMNVAEDGKPSHDSFEVWDINCILTEHSGQRPNCSITAVSLVDLNGETHVSTWRHDAESVREIGRGVLRVELNGRLSE